MSGISSDTTCSDRIAPDASSGASISANAESDSRAARLSPTERWGQNQSGRITRCPPCHTCFSVNKLVRYSTCPDDSLARNLLSLPPQSAHAGLPVLLPAAPAPRLHFGNQHVPLMTKARLFCNLKPRLCKALSYRTGDSKAGQFCARSA